jgi:5-(carboxyamino)imidazole ribonucleotide synthase
MTEPLSPGATIGILGGGQLGRMLSVAASRLGFRTCVFEPAGDCPASHVSNFHVKAGYDDEAALRRFAESVDVITYEFENILSDLGLATAPFAAVDDPEDLLEALAGIGMPGILKTRRFGYDGKGQARIDAPGEAEAALAAMNGQPAIYEGFVTFSHEVSVIAARGLSGEVACYDPGENVHEGGILRTSTVPARLSAMQRADAVLMAGKILNALDYVGVMGVELFVTPKGLIVNEIAPRVHNSGHWTQAGCAIDQFEQHIRAVAGWPLGDGARHSDVVMENLIGNDMDRLPDLMHDPRAALHLYGKAEVKPGRKMGHVNRVTGSGG